MQPYARRMPSHLFKIPPMIPAGLWRWFCLDLPNWTVAFWVGLLPAVFPQPLCAADSSAGNTNATRASGSALNPAYGVGSWIWDRETHDQQECRLWRSFGIPRSAVVKSAILRIMADNNYRLFLDGREIGRGSDWRIMTEYDLRLLLRPGTHILGVLAFNDFFVAGVVVGLRVRLTDGSVIEVGSDETWRVVPPGVGGGWAKRARAPASWPAATVVGLMGRGIGGNNSRLKGFRFCGCPTFLSGKPVGSSSRWLAYAWSLSGRACTSPRG